MQDLDKLFYRKACLSKCGQVGVTTRIDEIFLPEIISVTFYPNKGVDNKPTIALATAGGASAKHSHYIDVKDEAEYEDFVERWRLAKLAALGLKISS